VQVVLNLLLNGMEAMGSSARGERSLVVSTELTGARAVCVSVRDAGTGLGDGALNRAFEPFYTTKPTGMGMGLAISRSIIEAQGGAIWAENNPSGGRPSTSPCRTRSTMRSKELGSTVCHGRRAVCCSLRRYSVRAIASRAVVSAERVPACQLRKPGEVPVESEELVCAVLGGSGERSDLGRMAEVAVVVLFLGGPWGNDRRCPDHRQKVVLPPGCLCDTV
jgi:hypothetical protein